MANEKVLERLLHCIWSEQLFRKTLQVEGKTLAISNPGWWNLEAGPDFRNAEMFLDGVRLCGDVEIHLNSDDWYHHGHHKDPRYNGVALHVVLYESLRPCVRQDGQQIPQLVMKDYLLEELRLLQQRIPIHEFPFGPGVNKRLCRKFMEEQDPDSTIRILDSAGDQRMRRKKDHLLELIHAGGFQQAVYEAMMEGMGYKQSRFAFRELARRVPISELMEFDLSNRRGIDSMAAILLGTAGLLQDLAQIRLIARDQETSEYLDELFRYWKKNGDRFQDRRLVGFSWYPSSTRPANFPARRLTAVCAFFHYYKSEVLPLLLKPLAVAASEPKCNKLIVREWLQIFSRPLHLYWSYHFQFERKKFVAPVRLIGMDRARILAVNVVIPALLAHADLQKDNSLEQKLHLVYRHHPKLSQNSITKLMEHRMFGSAEHAKAYISTAHRQQALHHFFFDFCDNKETLCSHCELRNEGKPSGDE